MNTQLRIGIIGDYDPRNPTHIATQTSLNHAAEALQVSCLEISWLPTDQTHQFSRFHGLLCSPGSPYRSLVGALSGIRYAREHRIPFLGTCGGSQHMILEYARNVMGVRDAAHAETDPYASCLFITPLSCSLAGKVMEVNLKPESRAADIYKSTHAIEHYYCNFGLNPAYQQQLEDAGLKISGTDLSCEARIVELPEHPFFIGTLFVPQANSTMDKPHPILLELLRIASRSTAWSAGRSESASLAAPR
jgi:CTP synthase (UTP-ammonia lyase)